MAELVGIFVDVLAPVFGVAAAGFFAARRWKLDHRPLGTIAYWLLAPAFIYRLLSNPAAWNGPVGSMLASSFTTVLVIWVGVRLILRSRSGERKTLDAMVMTFGNVGNLGFPIVLFSLGEDALAPAAIHFLAVTIGVFILGVSSASRLRSGHIGRAFVRVVSTPAIAVVPLALLVGRTETQIPQALERFVGLLADAMIPVMLLTLGMQLASSRISSGVGRLTMVSVGKLVVAPLIYLVIAGWFGLTGVPHDSGLLLAAMPTAVLVGLISVEFDLETEFASAAILLTSVVSMVTLGVIIRAL
ncbi:MAG: AEC family transporter [Acidimicrobiia bacterium]|nr:AEC family transporter [Acidimicrobiia bacterium]